MAASFAYALVITDGAASPIADEPYDSDWKDAGLTPPSPEARPSALKALALKLEALFVEHESALAAGQTVCLRLPAQGGDEITLLFPMQGWLKDVWAKFQAESLLEDIDCGKEVERPLILSTSMRALSDFYTINQDTMSSSDAIGFYRLLMYNDSEEYLLDRGRELYVLNDCCAVYKLRHTAFPIPMGPHIDHALRGPKRLLIPSDLESQAFWKRSPQLSLVMKRAEKTWTTSAVLVPLKYTEHSLPRMIDNHFFISGVSSLRVAEGLGPIRNIEPEILLPDAWILLASIEQMSKTLNDKFVSLYKSYARSFRSVIRELLRLQIVEGILDLEVIQRALQDDTLDQVYPVCQKEIHFSAGILRDAMALFCFIGPFGLGGHCDLYGLAGPTPMIGNITTAVTMTYIWVAAMDETGQEIPTLEDPRVGSQFEKYIGYTHESAFVEAIGEESISNRVYLEEIWQGAVEPSNTWIVLNAFKARGVLAMTNDTVDI